MDLGSQKQKWKGDINWTKKDFDQDLADFGK